MSNIKEDVDVEKLYGVQSSLSKEQFLKEFKINENGLSTSEARNNINKYGLNEVKQSKPKKWYKYFLESLFSPFNSILLAIAAVLMYTDVYLAETPNYANIIVILILVISSTLLEFFEEYNSNKAAEKLKELVATTATVLRDGKETLIPIKQITVGDIVMLSAGSLIPADLRVLEAKDLYVGQSSLTGESDAVKKVVELGDSYDLNEPYNLKVDSKKNSSIDNISDLDNICFMGTNVISGSAKCAVIKTADDTYFGKVAHTIPSSKPKSAFQKRNWKYK